MTIYDEWCDFEDECGSTREFVSHRHPTNDLWTVELDPQECLEYNDQCKGAVEYRSSGGLRGWPRCEKHGLERLQRRENSMEIYADSDVAPSWFDPSYAGERWSED